MSEPSTTTDLVSGPRPAVENLLPRPISECPWMQPQSSIPIRFEGPLSKFWRNENIDLLLCFFGAAFLLPAMCLTLSWSKFFILILLGSLMLGTGLFSFKHRLAELRAWSTNCIVKQLFDNHVESLIVMDRSLELFHLPTTSSMKRLDFGVGRSDADEQRLANHLILRSLRQQIWTMISQFEPTSDVRELLGMVEVLRLVRMNIKLKEELVRVIRAQHGTIEIEVLLK